MSLIRISRTSKLNWRSLNKKQSRCPFSDQRDLVLFVLYLCKSLFINYGANNRTIFFDFTALFAEQLNISIIIHMVLYIP